MSFYPETQVVASCKDGSDYVYTVKVGAQTKEVRIPIATLAALPAGPAGVAARREVLGRAVQNAR